MTEFLEPTVHQVQLASREVMVALVTRDIQDPLVLLDRL